MLDWRLKYWSYLQQKDFGVIQNVCFTQNFYFLICLPHVHPCSFYMQDAYEFLNEKLRSEKGEKKNFFKTQHKRWQCFLHKYISMITTIKIFTYWNINKVYFICCLKNQEIFHREKIDIGLALPLPLFVFVRFLRAPLPPPQRTLYWKGFVVKDERSYI